MRQTLQEFMNYNKDMIFTVNKDNDKHAWGQYSISEMPNEFRNKEVIGIEPQFDNFIKVHIKH